MADMIREDTGKWKSISDYLTAENPVDFDGGIDTLNPLPKVHCFREQVRFGTR
jgi:hypothetical protein